MGCSMNLLVKCAKTTVSRIQKSRSRTRSGRPNALLGKTKAGQCHRYRGYEIAPNHCANRLLLKSLKSRGQIEMEPINKAVATTGKTALMPGKAVFSSKLNVAIPIPITPSHGIKRFRHKFSGMKSRDCRHFRA